MPLDQRWNGVQQAVSAGAADLSTSQYLELWIRGDRGQLHIDLGTISEDVDGNFDLNTEDLLDNGVRNGIVDSGEDVGMDGDNDEEELAKLQSGRIFNHNAHDDGTIQGQQT